MEPVKIEELKDQTEQNISELQKRIASVHAGAVIQYLQKLSCPYEQKQALLKAIQETAKER